MRIKQLSILSVACMWFGQIQAATLEVTVDNKPIKIPLYQAQDAKNGAIIFLSGDNPPCSSLSQQLADRFSKLGWDVAALNCQKSEMTTVQMIPEVISELRKKKNPRISILHYGADLGDSLAYFNQSKGKQIDALILVSAFDINPQKDNENSLKTPKMPIFDISGQFDWSPVQKAKALRKAQWKKTEYTSIVLSGANHDYEYQLNRLVAYTHGWMKRLPEKKVVAAPFLQSSIPYYRWA